MMLVGHLAGFLQGRDLPKVHAGVLLNGLDHGNALKGLFKIDGYIAVLNDGGAVDLAGHGADHILNQIHHAVIVGIGLIELDHGEFRIMLGIHALVAENAANLIHAREAAHDQALEVQLQRDAQIHIDIQRIVMGNKGARGGAARLGVKYRGFHLQKAAGIQELAHGGDDLAALYKGIAHLGVYHHIQVALTIAQVGIGQAMELLRQRL